MAIGCYNRASSVNKSILHPAGGVIPGIQGQKRRLVVSIGRMSNVDALAYRRLGEKGVRKSQRGWVDSARLSDVDGSWQDTRHPSRVR